ncbi:hypothetical protein AVEN_249921-2 [Araneus ventricosus]|uniref:Uncharacterized protein n=1 Tax=Araneus ventricosus TaxID=182803 RepID=A0A4Y2DX80_ARAVE|nr:hypothetical protein AVEN_249921-2 [Araneus ventricosus]
MSNTAALQWAAEVDNNLAQNEILTDDEIIRTVTAEDDDDDDDVTPVNPVKISHSEAVAALNTSLQWAEVQNFEAHEIMLLRRLRDSAFELKIGTAVQKKSLTFLDSEYVHSLTYVVIDKSNDEEAHLMFCHTSVEESGIENIAALPIVTYLAGYCSHAAVKNTKCFQSRQKLITDKESISDNNY